MNVKDQYIVIRVNNQGTVSVVHSSNSLKDARYWLTYIALNNDALMQTPSHPKYTGSGAPTYVAHLIKRGKIGYDEAMWKKSIADFDLSAWQMSA